VSAAASFFSAAAASGAACPMCGGSGAVAGGEAAAQLPMISPERLFFLCGASVRRFAVMPDGCGGEMFVVAVEGVVHAIRPAEWADYLSFCRFAESATTAALAG